MENQYQKLISTVAGQVKRIDRCGEYVDTTNWSSRVKSKTINIRVYHIHSQWGSQ